MIDWCWCCCCLPMQSRLIVQRMCHEPIRPFYTILVVLTIGALNSFIPYLTSHTMYVFASSVCPSSDLVIACRALYILRASSIHSIIHCPSSSMQFIIHPPIIVPCQIALHPFTNSRICFVCARVGSSATSTAAAAAATGERVAASRLSTRSGWWPSTSSSPC